MNSPGKIFFYYITIFLLLGLLSVFIPKQGIRIGKTEFVFRWININEVLDYNNTVNTNIVKKDSVYKGSTPKDSVLVNNIIIKKDSSVNNLDTLNNHIKDDLKNKIKIIDNTGVESLEYTPKFPEILMGFYSKIDSSLNKNKVIRILHMGDSQLEGDRITCFLREMMQVKFGGSGVGLVPLFNPLHNYPTLWISNKGNWKEDLVYNYPRIIKDNKYGIAGNISTLSDSLGGSVTFKRSSMAQPKAKRFYNARLYSSDIQDSIWISVKINGDDLQAKSFGINNKLSIIEWNLPKSPKKLQLTFKTNISPLFYGLTLDSITGVAVDNISFRGQASPRMDKTNHTLFKEMSSLMNVGLIVLQYGTNVVPTVSDNYDYYRVDLINQIKILQKVVPEVPIIVVGVGDIAKTINGKVQSIQYINKIVKAQREAALSCNCAFLNLYKAMGGEGSAITWAKMKPKRVLSDYTHFSRGGGKIVAKWIYNSIMCKYKDYKKKEKN